MLKSMSTQTNQLVVIFITKYIFVIQKYFNAELP